MDEEPEVFVYIEKTDYDASYTQYEKLADTELQKNSDTIIIGGYGCHVKVQHYALAIYYGRSHEEKTTKLYRGTHNVKQVVICIDSGYISFGAIRWCIDENITIIMLDWSGSLIQVLTPIHPGNAKLIWQQYTASQSGMCVDIARELIRRKTQSQIEAVRSKMIVFRFIHSSPYISSIIQLLEDGLSELPHKKTIETIRLHEAILASYYWQIFIGYPVKWDKSTAKIIPPHWLSITSLRFYPLSECEICHQSIPCRLELCLCPA